MVPIGILTTQGVVTRTSPQLTWSRSRELPLNSNTGFTTNLKMSSWKLTRTKLIQQSNGPGTQPKLRLMTIKEEALSSPPWEAAFSGLTITTSQTMWFSTPNRSIRSMAREKTWKFRRFTSQQQPPKTPRQLKLSLLQEWASCSRTPVQPLISLRLKFKSLTLSSRVSSGTNCIQMKAPTQWPIL